MLSPRRSKPSPDDSSSLDRKQQALREKEEQLRQATEQLRKMIDDAPRRKEEVTRRRREHLASDKRLSRSALVDKRFDVATTANPSVGQRQLRSERRDGKLLFLFLLCALIAAVVILLKIVLPHL